jgi:hypothetical protein
VVGVVGAGVTSTVLLLEPPPPQLAKVPATHSAKANRARLRHRCIKLECVGSIAAAGPEDTIPPSRADSQAPCRSRPSGAAPGASVDYKVFDLKHDDVGDPSFDWAIDLVR